MRRRFGEVRRAEGGDHEFLEVHRVVGMRAAVDDVHHRDGQGDGAGAAEVAVERRVLGRAAARAVAMETARMALAPRRPLLGVPSRAIMMRSISAWCGGVLAKQGGGDFAC